MTPAATLLIDALAPAAMPAPSPPGASGQSPFAAFLAGVGVVNGGFVQHSNPLPLAAANAAAGGEADPEAGLEATLFAPALLGTTALSSHSPVIAVPVGGAGATGESIAIPPSTLAGGAERGPTAPDAPTLTPAVAPNPAALGLDSTSGRAPAAEPARRNQPGKGPSGEGSDVGRAAAANPVAPVAGEAPADPVPASVPGNSTAQAVPASVPGNPTDQAVPAPVHAAAARSELHPTPPVDADPGPDQANLANPESHSAPPAVAGLTLILAAAAQRQSQPAPPADISSAPVSASAIRPASFPPPVAELLAPGRAVATRPGLESPSPAAFDDALAPALDGAALAARPRDAAPVPIGDADFGVRAGTPTPQTHRTQPPSQGAAGIPTLQTTEWSGTIAVAEPFVAAAPGAVTAVAARTGGAPPSPSHTTNHPAVVAQSAANQPVLATQSLAIVLPPQARVSIDRGAPARPAMPLHAPIGGDALVAAMAGTAATGAPIYDMAKFDLPVRAATPETRANPNSGSAPDASRAAVTATPPAMTGPSTVETQSTAGDGASQGRPAAPVSVASEAAGADSAGARPVLAEATQQAAPPRGAIESRTDPHGGSAPQLASRAGAAATDMTPRQALPAATQSPPAEQVALQLRNAVSRGVDRIQIQLKPASLGAIDVTLDVSSSARVAAVITVERAETLELLQRDARGLERALQDAGLRTDSGCLNFNLRGDGQQAQNHQPAPTHGDGNSALDDAADADEAADHESGASATPRASDRVLDINV